MWFVASMQQPFSVSHIPKELQINLKPIKHIYVKKLFSLYTV